MIAKSRAAELAAEYLALLPYWSSTAGEGKRRLAAVIAETSRDEKHARVVLQQWAAEARELPTEADIRRMAAASRPHAPIHGPRHDCQACGGTGWRPTLLTRDYERGPNGGPFTREIIHEFPTVNEFVLQGSEIRKSHDYAVDRAARCGCGGAA